MTARNGWILCTDGTWRNPAYYPDKKLPAGFPPMDPDDYPDDRDEH